MALTNSPMVRNRVFFLQIHVILVKFILVFYDSQIPDGREREDFIGEFLFR